MAEIAERRRFPRTEVRRHRVSIRSIAAVRVLDLSSGGVLLASAMPPADAGTLSLVLGRTAFSAAIDVRQRVTVVGDGGAEQRSGAVFLEMSAASRRALADFLAHAPVNDHQRVHES